MFSRYEFVKIGIVVSILTFQSCSLFSLDSETKEINESMVEPFPTVEPGLKKEILEKFCHSAYTIYLDEIDNEGIYLDFVPERIIKLISVINFFKINQKNHLFKNRLFLHGPPGTGKSSIALLLAKFTNSVLICVNGPSIVNSYQGSGANTINLLFHAAEFITVKTKRKVIIFIDEIDAIANPKNERHNSEFKNAVQNLWLNLDKVKNITNFYFVAASNKYKELNATFLERFARNILEVPFLSKIEIETFIDLYCSQMNKKLPNKLFLTKKQINSICIDLGSFGIRSIKDFLDDLYLEGTDDFDKILDIYKNRPKSKKEFFTYKNFKELLSTAYQFTATIGNCIQIKDRFFKSRL